MAEHLWYPVLLCSRLRLVAKVSGHVPNSQTGLSWTIWLPLTLMLTLHASVTVRIISGVGWLTYHPFPLYSVSPDGSYTLSTQHLSYSRGLNVNLVVASPGNLALPSFRQ